MPWPSNAADDGPPRLAPEPVRKMACTPGILTPHQADLMSRSAREGPAAGIPIPQLPFAPALPKTSWRHWIADAVEHAVGPKEQSLAANGKRGKRLAVELIA